MSSAPTPDPARPSLEQVEDGPWQDFKDGLTKQFGNFVKFWTTRRMVMRGLDIAGQPKEMLDSAGLLSSWKFNITESALASIPALFLKKILDFFYSSPKLGGLDDKVNSVFSWLWPIAVPFILFFVVRIVAWGSLKNKDSTQDGKRRARNGYLYLDGAYSFFPQIILSIAVVLTSVGTARSPLDTILERAPAPTVGDHAIGIAVAVCYAIGWILLFAAVVWEYFLKRLHFGRKLMLLNGYSSRLKWFWMIKDKGRNLGPWNKFIFAILYAVPVVTFAMSMVVWLASWLVGYAIYFIQGSPG